MAVKNYLQQQEGWNLNDLILDIVEETGLLKSEEMGENTLSMDECGIEWGGEDICLLETFVENYSSIFIKKMCNVLDSFMNEDIDYYFYDEN